jgi:hypothetical protein
MVGKQTIESNEIIICRLGRLKIGELNELKSGLAAAAHSFIFDNLGAEFLYQTWPCQQLQSSRNIQVWQLTRPSVAVGN